MELTFIDESQKRLTDSDMKFAEQILPFAAEQLQLPANAQMSVTFVTPDRIQEINREYRGNDKVTDVISFAVNDEESDLQAMQDAGVELDLGDSFVCLEQVEKQSESLEHSFQRELGYVLVHSLLHLLGYDHQNDEEANEMFTKQEEILSAYGLEK